jgi:hypothetical protein
VCAHFGGIGEYVALFEAQCGTHKSPFRGCGWLFNVSESFPWLSFMTFALLLWKRGRPPSWGGVAGALVVFFGLLILLGGLRVSRSNSAWSLF